LSSWIWTFLSTGVSTNMRRSGIYTPCLDWTSQRSSSTHSIRPANKQYVCFTQQADDAMASF
jgi:hypothetical protein